MGTHRQPQASEQTFRKLPRHAVAWSAQQLLVVTQREEQPQARNSALQDGRGPVLAATKCAEMAPDVALGKGWCQVAANLRYAVESAGVPLQQIQAVMQWAWTPRALKDVSQLLVLWENQPASQHLWHWEG